MPTRRPILNDSLGFWLWALNPLRFLRFLPSKRQNLDDSPRPQASNPQTIPWVLRSARRIRAIPCLWPKSNDFGRSNPVFGHMSLFKFVPGPLAPRPSAQATLLQPSSIVGIWGGSAALNPYTCKCGWVGRELSDVHCAERAIMCVLHGRMKRAARAQSANGARA